jgi:hypothetical protein
MSVVSIECCQVEVSVTGLSLDQRSPTDCGVSECGGVSRPWPTRGCRPRGGGGGGRGHTASISGYQLVRIEGKAFWEKD